MIKSILEKAMEKIPLSKEEAVALLQIDNNSLEFYELLATANALSRTWSCPRVLYQTQS